MDVIDIYSKAEYPANVLSNFYRNAFTMDDVSCASMEGFLQSLKVRSRQRQERICSLAGIEAKRAPGRLANLRWRLTGTLYWRGERIRRTDDAYQRLLDRAYAALLENESFRAALLASKGRRLVHSIGKTDARKTVLTEYELVRRLTVLRDGLISR